MIRATKEPERFSATYRKITPLWVAILLLSALTGCSSPDVNAAAQDKSVKPSKVKTDCSRVAAAKDREACFLALPAKECEALGSTCLALQQARTIENEMAAAEKNIISKARASYASYTADDPAYLDDLEKDFAASANAWRTYRDTYCQAEPLVQGMSRNEQDALSTACKMSITRSRIAQLEQLAKSIP
ncbi:lysozyme inhibitor LprI family protein [Xanthomonas citri]|uniref:lysozyme inhibitor LprI family protein n=1 Tax=Xanthomonas citri TaxID=346 RepID=UPI001E6008BF|nr:lysozyme inhibitor LprI family protein [Xanthomonas citri]WPM77412.1 lysozyme inhibitor LprI family protein [Xanthomonas citri pv. viticola]